MQQNQLINFGIISTAGIANKLFPALQSSEYTKVVAVASRNLEKAQKWATEHDNVKAYGTYEELLSDKSIDAVYIPLPTGLKYEWAKKSLEAGKHVLVEKPLSGEEDTKQLRELLSLAKEKQKQFMDCTMWVHSGRTKVMEEKLKSQEIGPVTKVISGLTFMSDEEWMSNNIRGDKSLEPLGALGDVVWYSSMASLWAFNFEKPERVQAINYQKNSAGVYQLLSGILYFPNNKIAFVDGSFIEAHRQNFEIVGQYGSYRMDDFVGGQNQNGDDSIFFKQFTGFGSYKQLDRMGKIETVEIEKSDAVLNMVNEFAQRIHSNDQTQYWGQRTLLNQSVMIHLNLSAQQNGKILDFNSDL